MAGQWAVGNQNVQIHDVTGSTIHVTFDKQRREVPLEPAVAGVGRSASPARLIRARSGVVPFAARSGLIEDLEGWARTDLGFAGRVIGGRGGTGKTRLGVELCVRARKAGWLAGLLSRRADPGGLEALVQTPTPRLVVIDYAESRAEQLEAMLPMLAVRATPEHPVRVLLLVRAAPRRTQDWTEALRHHTDPLDAVLDDVDVRVLEDDPLDLAGRRQLFNAAAGAFGSRVKPPAAAPPDPPAVLTKGLFANPLLVVIAAYLAVHTGQAVPTTRADLLEELVAHEDRHWRATPTGSGMDEELRRRVVALATLAGAVHEAEAVGLLRLIPDLATTSSERLGTMARWVNGLYPVEPLGRGGAAGRCRPSPSGGSGASTVRRRPTAARGLTHDGYRSAGRGGAISHPRLGTHDQDPAPIPRQTPATGGQSAHDTQDEGSEADAGSDHEKAGSHGEERFGPESPGQPQRQDASHLKCSRGEVRAVPPAGSTHAVGGVHRAPVLRAARALDRGRRHHGVPAAHQTAARLAAVGPRPAAPVPVTGGGQVVVVGGVVDHRLGGLLRAWLAPRAPARPGAQDLGGQVHLEQVGVAGHARGPSAPSMLVEHHRRRGGVPRLLGEDRGLDSVAGGSVEGVQRRHDVSQPGPVG